MVYYDCLKEDIQLFFSIFFRGIISLEKVSLKARLPARGRTSVETYFVSAFILLLAVRSIRKLAQCACIGYPAI